MLSYITVLFTIWLCQKRNVIQQLILTSPYLCDYNLKEFVRCDSDVSPFFLYYYIGESPTLVWSSTGGTLEQHRR